MQRYVKMWYAPNKNTIYMCETCVLEAFCLPLHGKIHYLAREMAQEKILITGASGFIGSFIVEGALARGMEVWAAVRDTSSLKYLQDSRIKRVNLDFGDCQQMTDALKGHEYDYVVHAAGLTKALHDKSFFDVNTTGTKNLVKALEATSPSMKRLVFISSLSVFGPVRERMPYQEIRNSDTPQPNTAYAKSKLEAEKWIEKNARIPYTILRPTGVYGPREKDYMMMVDSIRRGIDVAVGYKQQDLTFVYVRDVVEAVFLSMKSAKSEGKAYFLTDGEVYSSRTFSDLIIKELGKHKVLRLTLPVWVLRLVCATSSLLSHITGRLSTLNNDHFNIMKQRNWQCDIRPAKEDFGYCPQWKLHDGVREMLKQESR